MSSSCLKRKKFRSLDLSQFRSFDLTQFVMGRAITETTALRKDCVTSQKNVCEGGYTEVCLEKPLVTIVLILTFPDDEGGVA